ncbi:hypothetical protein ACFL1B_04910 [Nanoarchaeota archaeon]
MKDNKFSIASLVILALTSIWLILIAISETGSYVKFEQWMMPSPYCLFIFIIIGPISLLLALIARKREQGQIVKVAFILSIIATILSLGFGSWLWYFLTHPFPW